jgi:hypothetical protein
VKRSNFSKFFFRCEKMAKSKLISSGILGAMLFVSVIAMPKADADEISSKDQSETILVDPYNLEELTLDPDAAMEQVNNVSQLRDVSPGDWAFEALRNLVERYGCIAGYPDSTFRGDKPLTRYEFAAGLNACLQQVERLIAEGSLSKSDIESMQRLAQEFQAELANLGTRVDKLDARVGFLEDHQFSTTTKLAGEVVFGIASAFTGTKDDGSTDIDTNPVFGHRTRLELSTSFTGEDELFTRLSTGNFPDYAEVNGTPEGGLAFSEPADNDLGLEVLLYRFPVGSSTEVVLGAIGMASDDIANTANFLDGDGGSGAISAFGTRNPIYEIAGETGVGIVQQLGKNIELSVGYFAAEASDPNDGSALFNGPYSALAQVLFKPSDKFNVGLTYVHSYNASDTGSGSNLANFQSFSEGLFGESVPVSTNSYGLQLSWQLSKNIVIGGWAGYSKVTTLSTLDNQIERGSLDVLNWAVTLGLPDLGKEGNLAGIVVGMEPKVIDSSINFGGEDLEDKDSSLHIEAFYQYQINDNIAITPGVVWLTAPDHNSNNDNIIIGTIRTTFSF